MKTDEEVRAAFEEVGLSVGWVERNRDGSVTVDVAGYEGYEECSFGLFIRLAELLETQDISFSAEVNNGCPTCGGGLEASYTIRWEEQS